MLVDTSIGRRLCVALLDRLARYVETSGDIETADIFRLGYALHFNVEFLARCNRLVEDGRSSKPCLIMALRPHYYQPRRCMFSLSRFPSLL